MGFSITRKLLRFWPVAGTRRGPGPVEAWCKGGRIPQLRHALPARQAEVLIAGGVITGCAPRFPPRPRPTTK